jgi:hypothetical protein
MDITQWFQLLSASELQALTPQIQVSLSLNVSLKSLLSESVQNQQSLNSVLFVAYLVVSLLIKKPSYMLAFFISCMLFEINLFDPLSESQLYAITFAIYSYVALVRRCKIETTIACVIILIICVALGYDAYFYGIGGAYGASETFVYNNIEHFTLYAHIILICTLIPYRRIRDSIRRFTTSILLISRNSAYFTPI